MNNVLKHRGYRFYQSSYDQDELGTILSVKRDRAGTAITYVGYFFMILGMILALIDRGTRFSRLARSTAAKSMKTAVIAGLILLFGINASGQDYPSPSKDVAS
jgi:hypothetical protein